MSRNEVRLVVASIAFALAMGEVATRFLLPPPYTILRRRPALSRGMPKMQQDPQLGWVTPQRDATYHFRATGDYGVVDAAYHLNQGMRVTSSEAQSGPLALFVGCSFTFGLGINDEDTWPWMVQERVRDLHVVNAGVNGYGVVQSLLWADRLIAQARQPVAIVVVGFADFQVERDRAGQNALYSTYPAGRPRVVPTPARLNYRGLVRYWAPGLAIEHSHLLMHAINVLADVGNGTAGRETAPDVTARAFVEFAERWRARGVKLAVVVLPHGNDQRPAYRRPREIVVMRLNQAHIPYLSPEFPRLPNGDIDANRFLIPSDRFHPNRAYNLLLASQVSSFLEAQVVRTRAGTPSPAMANGRRGRQGRL